MLYAMTNGSILTLLLCNLEWT